MVKTIHSEQYAIFLNVFRRARQRSGMTQVQVAEAIGETQSFVSKCERGERRIDIVELREFCRLYGISLNQFTNKFERAAQTTARTRRR